MRHGSHSTSSGLDTGASGEGLSPGGGEVVVDISNCDEGANENQEEEDGPAVEPYLRKSSSKAEVWCEVW